MGVGMYLYCNSKDISQTVAQELYRNDDTLHQNCWSNGMIGYWHNQYEINNWFKMNTEEYKDWCGIYNVDGLALYKLYGNVCRALEERDYKLFPARVVVSSRQTKIFLGCFGAYKEYP